ncbi:MAG: hypothetical protein K2H01_09135 [Ruminococcus sp.]|nr:hypothetical protein [Ruminococcus sp.]
MFQVSAISWVSDTKPLLNGVFFIVSIVFCVIGIIIILFEIPEHPARSIIYEVAQIAGSICLLTNIGLAESVGNVVFGILIVYGLLQALIHWNPIYVIYIFW